MSAPRPEDLLPWLAHWIGMAVDRGDDPVRQRELLRSTSRPARQAGNAARDRAGDQRRTGGAAEVVETRRCQLVRRRGRPVAGGAAAGGRRTGVPGGRAGDRRGTAEGSGGGAQACTRDPSRTGRTRGLTGACQLRTDPGVLPAGGRCGGRIALLLLQIGQQQPGRVPQRVEVDRTMCCPQCLGIGRPDQRPVLRRRPRPGGTDPARPAPTQRRLPRAATRLRTGRALPTSPPACRIVWLAGAWSRTR